MPLHQLENIFIAICCAITLEFPAHQQKRSHIITYSSISAIYIRPGHASSKCGGRLYLYLHTKESAVQSYILHYKHRPLVKPMFVSTSGYFRSVIGPYYSNGKNPETHNSEWHTKEFKQCVCENDVIIVDRGFRDSVELLARNWRKNRNDFLC